MAFRHNPAGANPVGIASASIEDLAMLLFIAIVVVLSLAAYTLIGVFLKVFLKPLPESESDNKKAKDSSSKSNPKVAFRNPINFIHKASRAFMSVIKYLAKLAVRLAPVMPAMATNNPELPVRAAWLSSSLPARYTSRLYKAVDYSDYDTPTYIRKAEAAIASQRNKRKSK